MSTNRLGFRHFLNIAEKESSVQVMLDANVLIAAGDEVHSDHELIRNFMSELGSRTNVIYYTTLITKAEYLEYQRRRFLTEGLFSFTEEIRLSERSAAVLNQIKRRRNQRFSDEEKRSKNPEYSFDVNTIYLFDREIKELKKNFRALDSNDEHGWLSICALFLKQSLKVEEKILDQICEYLSPVNPEQNDLFKLNNIDWKKATHISTETGMSFSDALILNMLNHTNIKYIISLDFDMVYGVAVSAQEKYVILPDHKISNYKKILKGVTTY